MIAALLVFISIPLAGAVISRRLWKALDTHIPLSSLEAAVSALVCGAATWFTGAWVLALTGTLTFGGVLVLILIFGGLSVAFFARPPLWPAVRNVPPYLPLLAWLVYVLWRAPLLPPLNHDALSYHFTRAVLMVRARGFERFGLPDHRVDDYPANYELLVAQVLAFTHSDLVTEWISTAAYIGLLVTSAALARRWWPNIRASTPVTLAVASTPLLLLASGADKNDLLAGLFCTTFFLWIGKWMTEGGRMPLLLAILSLAIAVGTKPTAAVVVAGGLLPVGLRVARHRPSFRGVCVTGAVGVLSFAMLGGAAYISNLLHTGSPIGGSVHDHIVTGTEMSYGDWQNLWQRPYLLLTVPFAADPLRIAVPWLSEYWSWPRYELFFSHFGYHFTLLAALIPLGLVSRADPERRRERIVIAAASAIAFGVLLPIRMQPVGFFATFPRFVLFASPVIAALALPPLVRSAGRLRHLVTAAAITVFVLNAVEFGAHDRFAPFDYVIDAARHGGTREVFFRPQRAANVFDRLAGPDDAAAFLGGFDAWSYPLFGEHQTRAVIFLSERTTTADLDPRIQWVVIDQAWMPIWGRLASAHPSKDESSRGEAWVDSVTDLRLLHSLLRSREFELLYIDVPLNQGVFRRRVAVEPR